jgi:hypothetical protein
MFLMPRPRHLIGATTLLSAALLTGCQNTPKNDCCKKCDKCSPCLAAATPAVPAKPSVPAHATAKAIPNASTAQTPSAVQTPSTYDSMPPVSNERYIPPAKQQTVVAAKPAPEVVAPPVAQPTPPASVSIPPASSSIPTATLKPVEEPPVRRSFPDITARPEFTHANDYSSLTGTLSFIPQKNQWRLRFASIDVEDRYGGSVTLDVGPQMKQYHDGQIVKVDGHIVDQDSHDPSPLYRVNSVSLVK